jgi:peptidoglycan hydrolase-like protein with peptidoglycan-binding domain
MARPTIRRGSTGAHVRALQAALKLNADGNFGPTTEAAVHRLQREHGLTADGVVGPVTWEIIDRFHELPPEAELPPDPLDRMTKDALSTLAISSPIARYHWRNRGPAPRGYIKGMAVAYATVVHKFRAGNPAALEMAKANTHNADRDALSWYAGIFNELGMNNDRAGLDTLRHLFVLLLGLGMRESTGRHCLGRDVSAKNKTHLTAEAGLFQASWNFSISSPHIVELFDQFHAAGPTSQCNLEIFREGVNCTKSQWANHGSGKGVHFQQLTKSCPQFAVESVAVGVRNLRKHWGPINRRDVEIKREADLMFKQVEGAISETS